MQVSNTIERSSLVQINKNHNKSWNHEQQVYELIDQLVIHEVVSNSTLARGHIISVDNEHLMQTEVRIRKRKQENIL